MPTHSTFSDTFSATLPSPLFPEGIPSLLNRFNISSPGPRLYGWSVLLYAEGMGLTYAELLQNFNDICSTIQEMPDAWLSTNNQPIVLVDHYRAHQPGFQVCKSDYGPALLSLGTPAYVRPRSKAGLSVPL